MIDSFSFPKGPDTSSPDDRIAESFGVRNPPAFCGTNNVWAAANSEDLSVYALYHGGTNRLVVLEKRENIWKRIDLQDIENIYPIIWKMCLKINSLRRTQTTARLMRKEQ